jgi:glycosyltransferase involved in cell wall biosynthesis
MRFPSLFASPARPLPRDSSKLRITAVIAVHDDELYLDRCFQGMAEHGVDAIVIDNDTKPKTAEIIARWQERGLVREILHHPNSGCMDWTSLLARKQEVVNTREADWFILWDSDEYREPPEGYRSLRDAFVEAGAAGYDTIGFDEFVFVPSTPQEDYTATDFVREMDRYYYFRPRAHQRLNAFRKLSRPVDLMSGAGHHVHFRGQRIWPKTCVLRHYLFLSESHGRVKYGRRQISRNDLARGWMKERANTSEQTFRLPDPSVMIRKDPAGQWDRSAPISRHPCFVYTA